MFASVCFLIFSLGLILLAAEGFTNGIELVGRRLSFSQAVVGSILAAVGTALPETILPLVAILSKNNTHAQAIGVGAILGAPFMLATVGFFLIGVSAVIACRKNGRALEIRAEVGTIKRDLTFFLSMYSAAILIPMIMGPSAKVPVALLLLVGYAFYVWQTVQGESAGLEHFESLHFVKLPVRFGWLEEGAYLLPFAAAQILCALAVMVIGAQVFVKHLGVVSAACGFDPLLFALLIAPVATELPEKFNTVTWMLKGKDTLAVGNMTGAMVFQATFPVSIGLLLTSWDVHGLALMSAILAILSAAVVLGFVTFHKKMAPGMMMFGGLLYAVYAVIVMRQH
ncbi:MAG: sodium:calcium antiporter [Candidatus Omnitrophica bacterium]|nr:sodium:calcium antiporter [Candidatus Omnitrophota bacterium]